MALSEDVPAESIFDAWALVTMLDSRRAADGSTEIAGEVAQTCRALVMLSGVVSGLLAGQVCARGDDPLELAAPLLRRTLRCGADPATLPTLAGLLTAGLLGHDTIEWSKTHLTRISGPGKQGLLYLVWSQRSLYDHLTDEGELDALIASLLVDGATESLLG